MADNTNTTAPVIPAKPHRTLLQIIGADAKAVFGFLTSKRGQVAVGAVEAAVEVEFPLATGAINLFNVWFGEIVKSEALAAAAGQQDGTGTQKAAMSIEAMTPQFLDFAKQHGLSAPTGDKLKLINDSLATAFNALVTDPPPAKF